MIETAGPGSGVLPSREEPINFAKNLDVAFGNLLQNCGFMYFPPLRASLRSALRSGLPFIPGGQCRWGLLAENIKSQLRIVKRKKWCMFLFFLFFFHIFVLTTFNFSIKIKMYDPKISKRVSSNYQRAGGKI